MSFEGMSRRKKTRLIIFLFVSPMFVAYT
ncbi:hypothetical protein LCGC14_2833140, partial [marine sediment metagenome]